MTAEIAVMNRMGVALAADSAVTIGGQKIYNSASKLFTLSKYQPVGIMVYGNADLNNVPWETIIKTFRKELADSRFDSLKEYSDEFIAFLSRRADQFFPVPDQKENFLKILIGHFCEIRHIIEERVCKSNREFSEVTSTEIRKRYKRLKEKDFLDCIITDDTTENDVVSFLYSMIEYSIGLAFEGLSLSIYDKNYLFNIGFYLFCKDWFTKQRSGIVVAGFGENDIFPSLVSLHVDFVFDNKLKYRLHSHKEVNNQISSVIFPFAQKEMVQSFINGIDPNYMTNLVNFLVELFAGYPDILVKNIDKITRDAGLNCQITDKQKDNIKYKLSEINVKILDYFFKNLNNYQDNEHIRPVLDSVAFLPKDELALMAESLVNLTSFKRRISLRELETVGGPVDVAVISKGDGFIWIRRKHYFKPELNHQFFENYYSEE